MIRKYIKVNKNQLSYYNSNNHTDLGHFMSIFSLI